MYFSRNQRAIIFLIVCLVLLFSTIRYFDGEAYFCDGYVEEAVLMQQKISNPYSDISLAPYRPDKNITLERTKLFFKGNMSWVDEFHWTKELNETIENKTTFQGGTQSNINEKYSLSSKGPLYSPTRPVYPILIAFTNLIFGNIFFSATLVNIIFVLLCAYLLVLFSKEYNFSSQTAFIAILFFLTSSTTITFFISGHTDFTALFFGMYAILMLKKYYKTKKNKYVFWYLLSAIIAVFTREIFILLSILPLFYKLDKKTIMPRIAMMLFPPILYFLYLYWADLIYLFIEVRVIGTKAYMMLYPTYATVTSLCLAFFMCFSFVLLFFLYGFKNMHKNPLFIFTIVYLTYLIVNKVGFDRHLIQGLFGVSFFGAVGLINFSKNFKNQSRVIFLITTSIILINFCVFILRII